MENWPRINGKIFLQNICEKWGTPKNINGNTDKGLTSPNNAMCAQHTKVLRTYEACSGARWAALRGSLSWWTLCAALSRAASLRQWGQRRLHRRTRMLAGKRMGVGTALAFTALHLLPFVSGHGRLMDPPARNSMWRWKRNCKIGRKKKLLYQVWVHQPNQLQR